MGWARECLTSANLRLTERFIGGFRVKCIGVDREKSWWPSYGARTMLGSFPPDAVRLEQARVS
jgi:hypothetical protein